MEVIPGQMSVRVPVQDGSQVGEARRAALRVAAGFGLSEAEAGRLAVVVTEAAGNLARHGGGGELLLRSIDWPGPGLELIALDHGPGVADVQRAFEDGHSTAGTPGTGLGAIRRLSSECELYSRPGGGTALIARVGAEPPAGPGPLVELGAVSLPLSGERVCGDGWAVSLRPGVIGAMVADGLGHGPLAAKAAMEAVRVFSECAAGSPGELIEAVHGPLRATRGAAVAVASIDLTRRVMTFAGVGNIAGSVLAGGRTRNAVSLGGIVGHEHSRVGEFEYPWPEGAVLVMHSDGLQSQWGLEAYPGLERSHPALLAGVLYRDYARGRDDVTVLAVREPR
jgi:anti-sigma regulatory factor (Ser/Thr protein kinase)